jgi:hypothetical protein
MESISELGTTLAVTSNCYSLLLVIDKVVSSSQILSTPMMEAMLSSETSVLARATRRYVPEDGILLPEVSSITFHF